MLFHVYILPATYGSPHRQPGHRARLATLGTDFWYYTVNRKQRRTLRAIHAHPTSANLLWRDIEALFVALGAEISEREGSRVAVFLFGEVRVFHRPHPSPMTDKRAIASIRAWLELHGVLP